jgi:hypothetical protein
MGLVLVLLVLVLPVPVLLLLSFPARPDAAKLPIIAGACRLALVGSEARRMRMSCAGNDSDDDDDDVVDGGGDNDGDGDAAGCLRRESTQAATTRWESAKTGSSGCRSFCFTSGLVMYLTHTRQNE